MPIVGVVCNKDQTFQSFETCISCHENRSRERNCDAPVFVLKSMRDNHIHRSGAGISASTLLQCPRAVWLEDKFDLYEPVISGYNKGRGSWVHAMIEVDRDPPPWIIREQRLYMVLDGQRITGQPDEIDTKFKVLIDYKSKDNLPLQPDDSHEAQFNFYAHLLREGMWTRSSDEYEGVIKDQRANIHVETIAAHYLTWKTKAEKAWKKKVYPLWTPDYTDRVIRERLAPLTAYYEQGTIPSCSPYIKNARWKCQCEKWETQLAERGIFV